MTKARYATGFAKFVMNHFLIKEVFREIFFPGDESVSTLKVTAPQWQLP